MWSECSLCFVLAQSTVVDNLLSQCALLKVVWFGSFCSWFQAKLITEMSVFYQQSKAASLQRSQNTLETHLSSRTRRSGGAKKSEKGSVTKHAYRPA